MESPCIDSKPDVCDGRCEGEVVKVFSEYEYEDVFLRQVLHMCMSNRVLPNKPPGPDSAEPDLTLRNTFSFDT